MYLLDTNIVSYALQPQHRGLRIKIMAELLQARVAISAVTRAEIRAGQARMQIDDKRREAINFLLNQLPTLDWTIHAADKYGYLHSSLASAGQAIGIIDTQIAAHALAEGLIVVTHNTKHFERVNELKIEDWLEAVI